MEGPAPPATRHGGRRRRRQLGPQLVVVRQHPAAAACRPQSWTILPSLLRRRRSRRATFAGPGRRRQSSDPATTGGTYSNAGPARARVCPSRSRASARDQSTGAPSASTQMRHQLEPAGRRARSTLTASNPPNTSLGGTVDDHRRPRSRHRRHPRRRRCSAPRSPSRLPGRPARRPNGSPTTGRSTHISAMFGGIRAGADYSATATVTPAGPGRAFGHPVPGAGHDARRLAGRALHRRALPARRSRADAAT